MTRHGVQKRKLTKQLKYLNEVYDKYAADASKQSYFEAIKKYKKGEEVLRITLIKLKMKLKPLILKLLTLIK